MLFFGQSIHINNEYKAISIYILARELKRSQRLCEMCEFNDTDTRLIGIYVCKVYKCRKHMFDCMQFHKEQLSLWLAHVLEHVR